MSEHDDDILYEEDPLDIKYPTTRITLIRKSKYDRAIKERDQYRDLLLECREYFEDCADAELVGDPAEWQGNEEAVLLGRIEQALGLHP